MRVALFSCILASTVAAFAQNSAPTNLPSANLPMIEKLIAGACPVGMTAQRQASGQREWIVSLEDVLQPQRPDTRANKAGVRVELVGYTGKAMRQAEVVVDYMAPGVHALQVQAGAPIPSSNLKKTFVLSAANAESETRLKGSLLVDHAASVTRVRLLSIEYSDGTTWQAKTAGNCTVEPSLFMAASDR